MTDGPSYTGQSVLNGFIFDGPPQSASSHARGALLRIDDRITKIAREVDYEAIFDRRGTRGAMASAADRDLEFVRPRILERKGNIVIIFHKRHKTSRALRVDCPPRDSFGISIIVRGHDIPFEGLLKC
jgi:hypothetical protein